MLSAQVNVNPDGWGKTYKVKGKIVPYVYISCQLLNFQHSKMLLIIYPDLRQDSKTAKIKKKDDIAQCNHVKGYDALVNKLTNDRQVKQTLIGDWTRDLADVHILDVRKIANPNGESYH